MSLCLSLAMCAVVGLTSAPLAEAEIISVTVNTTRDYEKARHYTYAEITIRGSVTRADGSVGQYTVPAVVIYPRDRGNGVGVVDWLNCAFYHFFPPSTEFGTLQFTLLATGNHLFEERYTYATVLWDKAVTEIFGPTAPNDGQDHNHLVFGSIDRSADAWEILLDTARLLKNPRLLPGDRHQVRKVLSSGYSQGAAAQLEVITAGLDPARVYDGHLIQMVGLTCWKREDLAPHFGFFGDCAPLPTNGKHAPVILLASQSDMLIFHPSVLGFGLSAFFTRNATNHSWRQYEMAAISHLPKPILDLGAPNQNPADARPIFRAAFDNLVRWIRGVPPPPALYFQGGVDDSNAFVPVLDADGNWEGGLRLPHISSTVLGRSAGAPLGTYDPLNDAGLDPFNPFALISGTFTRFSDAEILARYPTRQTYVRRVALAAVALAQRHYITDDDAAALTLAAESEPLSDALPAREPLEH